MAETKRPENAKPTESPASVTTGSSGSLGAKTPTLTPVKDKGAQGLVAVGTDPFTGVKAVYDAIVLATGTTQVLESAEVILLAGTKYRAGQNNSPAIQRTLEKHASLTGGTGTLTFDYLDTTDTHLVLHTA